MATIQQIMKSDSERAHQTALFAWAAVARAHGFEAADQWADTGALPIGRPDADTGALEARAPGEGRLEWMHAVHNQGHGDAVRGAQARAAGVRAGVADIFLPVPVATPCLWAGLYIELKRPRFKPKREGARGGVSDVQRAFAEYATAAGYRWQVAYGWREAADMVKRYLRPDIYDAE